MTAINMVGVILIAVGVISAVHSACDGFVEAEFEMYSPEFRRRELWLSIIAIVLGVVMNFNLVLEAIR